MFCRNFLSSNGFQVTSPYFWIDYDYQLIQTVLGTHFFLKKHLIILLYTARIQLSLVVHYMLTGMSLKCVNCGMKTTIAQECVD